MRFGILGPVEAWSSDGAAVLVGGPRVRSLLAMLALEAGRVVSTDRLLNGLYGEDQPAGAANALQSQVSRLRRGLADAGSLVEFHPAGYRLAIDLADVDAHQFSRQAEAGRQALTGGDATRAERLLSQALELWRGPALADVTDAPFAAAQVSRWHDLRASAVEERTEARLQLGQYAWLVADLRDAVAEHPLRERLWGQLMRALYGAGRPAEALAVFEQARRLLADELGTDPSAELTAVHLAVLRAENPRTESQRTESQHAQGPRAEPSRADARRAEPQRAEPRAEPVRPSPAPPLPAQLTTFVGRDEDLLRIGKLLDAGRLVTVIGPGGAGKTRLAIEAGERVVGGVSVGVGVRGKQPDQGTAGLHSAYFVDLAPLGSGAELAQAVLSALGLRESGLLHPGSGRPDQEGRLIAALSDQETLLILDNCEHVIADAARLAHLLLTACPGLRVLATSREPLTITGEALWPLGPLGLPPTDVESDHVPAYPAVRLFADRAVAVNPAFALTPANALVVSQICTALDGLPLAIELAAARLRSLTVAEVAARLDDRFRLLSRGSRTATPRHQTLWSVVQWSWDLLTEPERILARRLTVFAGGTSIEAARAVSGAEADLLAELTDKSLVEAAGGRYRMLDTIRVFCGQQLADAGELEPMSAAHARYFLALAEAGDEGLRSGDQLTWLARLSIEQSNLQAALRWAARSDPALGLRLVAVLSFYWMLRGLRAEAAPLAAELLDTIGHQPPDGLEQEYVACVLNAAAGGWHGERLVADLERAEDIILGLDQPPRYVFIPVLLAQVLGFRGAEMQRQSVPILGPPWLVALSHIGQGFFGLYTGQLPIAEAEFTTALAKFRQLDDRWGMATAMDTLARLASWRGDRDRSVELIAEALNLLGQLGGLEDMSNLLASRAETRLRGGDLAGAEADYRRAAELGQRSGAAESVAGAYLGLGDLARLREDLDGAQRLYGMASARLASGWSAGEPQWRLLIALGWVAQARGDSRLARARHREALDHAVSTRNNLVAAHAAEGLAGVATAEGDGEQAARLLGLGVALRGCAIAGHPDVARVAASARNLAGAQCYDRAYVRGTSTDREAALALLTAEG